MFKILRRLGAKPTVEVERRQGDRRQRRGRMVVDLEQGDAVGNRRLERRVQERRR